MDRQWDARFNVPTDEDLSTLLDNIKAADKAGKFQYVLVSGVEIGTRPFQTDHLMRHVHCAFVFANRVSKSSVLKTTGHKIGNSYYLVPRDRNQSVEGWIAHHKKEDTKINDTLVLHENGLPPANKPGAQAAVVKRSPEEKKRKLDDIIREMKDMIEEGREKEAFSKFPRNYLTYGEKIKAMVSQRRQFFKTNGHPHIWLTGYPGSGKSAILQVIYPDYYNKDLNNRFFDLFKPDEHTHTLLQDVDHETINKLGVQFFKTACDEAGFPIDQKYKTPQPIRTTVLVSSNFTIEQVVPEDMPGRSDNIVALRRRFWEVDINNLLRLLGLKLISKYEIKGLKLRGNTDPSKIFMDYDYLRDIPTGDPIKEPAYYQEMIKRHYYGPEAVAVANSSQ